MKRRSNQQVKAERLAQLICEDSLGKLVPGERCIRVARLSHNLYGCASGTGKDAHHLSRRPAEVQSVSTRKRARALGKARTYPFPSSSDLYPVL